MKLTTIQSFLIITIIISTTSCSEQSLTGHWNLRQVDLMDVAHQGKQITLDLTKPDKMKAYLYEASLPKELDFKEDSGDTSKDEIIDTDTTVGVNAMKAD